MLKVTREQVITALGNLGLKAGDGVMVHSALQFLGQPVGGLGMYYEALCAVLDIDARSGTGQGTLVVPTFNFGFARGLAFDQASTPAEEMGVFPEFVRHQPGARRTPHPMQSLVAVGALALDLAGRDTSSAFDPGSAFDRMVEMDFKLVLLGADVRFTSLIHYAEQSMQVPYRYWKEFTGRVRLTGRPAEVRTYRMYARDLALDPEVASAPVQKLLEKHGRWSSMNLNYGKLAACSFRDFVAAAEALLDKDPWALVQNRPQ